jgi:hypothetical protein
MSDVGQAEGSSVGTSEAVEASTDVDRLEGSAVGGTTGSIVGLCSSVGSSKDGINTSFVSSVISIMFFARSIDDNDDNDDDDSDDDGDDNSDDDDSEDDDSDDDKVDVSLLVSGFTLGHCV